MGVELVKNILSILAITAFPFYTFATPECSPTGKDISYKIEETQKASHIKGEAWSTPQVLKDGTTMVGGQYNRVFCFRSDGTVKHIFHPKEEMGRAAGQPLELKDGSVVVNMGKDFDDFAGTVNFLTSDCKQKMSADGKPVAYKTGQMSTGATLFKDGSIVVGTDTGKILFLDKDANLKKQIDVGSSIPTPPVEMEDGTIAVVTLFPGGVKLFSPDGKLKGSFEQHEYVVSPLLIRKDGTMIINCQQGHLHFLKFDGSKISETKRMEGPGGHGHNIELMDDDTLVAAGSNEVKFISTDGNIKSTKIDFTPSTINKLKNGMIFLGSPKGQNGHNSLLDKDGKEIAQFQTAGAVRQPPYIEGNQIVISTNDPLAFDKSYVYHLKITSSQQASKLPLCQSAPTTDPVSSGK